MSFFNNFRLKMKARRDVMPAKREFRQAAFAYLLLKSIIILLTVKFLACPNCGTASITRQAFHLALGAHFLFAGMPITSFVVSIFCLMRGFAYFVNFFLGTAFYMTLPVTGTRLSLLQENGAGNWFFMINAILLFVIAGMIIRAVKTAYSAKREAKMEKAPAYAVGNGVVFAEAEEAELS